MTVGDLRAPGGADRAAVERAITELVLGVAERQTAPGASIVVEGAAGMGKTFLAQKVLAAVPSGQAKVLRVAGQRGRRNDPFTVASQLLGDAASVADPAEATFDHVDELCADGPVVLLADDAHYLDAASLTLLRRLVWASGSLPLALLITTRPIPARESLAMVIRQAQVQARLPPMGRMMVERLVFQQTGRWPGPLLRRILDAAAGNPLFVRELLRGYRDAGALAELGADGIEARFELEVPATGLDQVIRAHVAQLDEPVRDVLGAMAVWGSDIGMDDLASMLFSSPSAVDQVLELAAASGLVHRDRAGTIGFSHDLFREVTYDELTDAQRRAAHRRAAEVLTAAGHRPSLVADHLLRAARTDDDPALVPALQEAVAATSGYAPEVTADLLDDVAAIRADVPEQMLLDHAEALFQRGRGEAAETLIRQRIATVTDPAVAARLQQTLIRSLMNRAEVAPSLEVLARTLAIPGLTPAISRQLEGTRTWLLVLAGQGPSATELDAMMARYAATGDDDGRLYLLAPVACTAFLAGHPDQALEHLRTLDTLLQTADDFLSRSASLSLPVMFELAASGVAAAQAQVDRTRRLAAERQADWIDPFLGTAAGAVAYAAGDWDNAVAELDAALEQAEETGTGWISLAVGFRAYIDAHRSRTGPARARLETFRHRGYPLTFGQDRPGLAELAVLECEGRIQEAAVLARTLWSAARDRPNPLTADLVLDAARMAMAAMDRRLADQLGHDVPDVCPAMISLLVRGMLNANPDAIGQAADELACDGRLAAEAFAREELACAAAATGDRDRADAALDAALAGYQRMGAAPDQDRALARGRALGLRRSSREPHRDAAQGWAALTVTEARIAALVRDGLTNREIGTRLFVSPRTVQTHVSHILQKTGLRSRVEIARFAEA